MLDTSFIQFKLDYSGSKNQPIGGGTTSDDSIFAGGCTWTTACHPRGINSSDNGEYLSLFTFTKSKSLNVVKTVFHAFLMGGDGAPSLSHAKSSSQITVGTDVAFIGWHRFIKRSDLESGGYLADGCVTFVCGIIDLDSNRISVPASDLGNHLGHLLECTDGSDDVSFSVGGERFRAHRAVLAARSPVFKAQLFGFMAEAKMDRITLHDIQPATFQLLLRFMYTDSLPTDDDMDSSSSSTVELLQHLLAAADMYHLDRLKLMCAQKLGDRVSPENVAAMLGCADTHSCPELKKRCIDFFVVEKNFKNAVLTEGYLRLLQGFPALIDEIRARVIQP